MEISEKSLIDFPKFYGSGMSVMKVRRKSVRKQNSMISIVVTKDGSA